MSVVGTRVRDGDDELLERTARSNRACWRSVRKTSNDDGHLPVNGVCSTSRKRTAVPALGRRSKLRWALGKKVGDIAYVDERGNAFDLRPSTSSQIDSARQSRHL
jgi:hypothetical protein